MRDVTAMDEEELENYRRTRSQFYRRAKQTGDSELEDIALDELVAADVEMARRNGEYDPETGEELAIDME